MNLAIMPMVANLLNTLVLDEAHDSPSDIGRHRRALLRCIDASLHTAIGPDGYPQEDIGYGTCPLVTTGACCSK